MQLDPAFLSCVNRHVAPGRPFPHLHCDFLSEEREGSAWPRFFHWEEGRPNGPAGQFTRQEGPLGGSLFHADPCYWGCGARRLTPALDLIQSSSQSGGENRTE